MKIKLPCSRNLENGNELKTKHVSSSQKESGAIIGGCAIFMRNTICKICKFIKYLHYILHYITLLF